MSFQNGYCAKAPNLRIRAVREMECCLVYTPDCPNIYTLNSAAWLIFELADGRSWTAAEAVFVDAMQSLIEPDDARRRFRDGFADLAAKGLVRIEPAHAGEPKNTEQKG